MDTLVTGARDQMPLAFQRKFLPLPEYDLLIAGTGHAGFINGWFQYLLANMNVVSIDELNEEAPSILRASVDANGGLDGFTATIYHFGYSTRENRYVGYAYRSEHDFRSDRLQYALGYKPVVQIMPPEEIRFPDFFIDIILKQQHQDLLQPIIERQGIGGEIEFAVMSEHAIRVETVHRFSSYEAESIHIQKRAEP